MELDELVTDGAGRLQCKEKARWIKYEEDVELGGEWGKPHISSLSFHSLLELRKLLEHGVALFDLNETNLSEIIRKICATLKERGILDDRSSCRMQEALMIKHSSVIIFISVLHAPAQKTPHWVLAMPVTPISS